MSAAAIDAATLPLATALVRISREMGVGVERLRAEQLIRNAQSAWPGESTEMWSKWLLEASQSVCLRARLTRQPLDSALSMARDGALVVGFCSARKGAVVVLDSDGSDASVADGEIDHTLRIDHDALEEVTAPGEGEPSCWLVVDHPEISAAEKMASKPIRRLIRLVRPEWPDIWVILVFAFFAGVLNLATPIAVEALVNTVAFGRLLQPVLVLATLLFGFLAFAAVMQGLQTYVAEIIQRRLFARIAADLAYRLPRVDHSRLDGSYGPELVNRFLDVVTVQKTVAALLLDGVSIVLATVVGMTVLAFYHPWLLGFDVLLLGLMAAGLVILGRGAVSSGIKESKMKYRLVSWFEDLIRCEVGFKTQGGADFAIDRANLLTTEYLTIRRTHFGVLFRQISFTLALQAIAGTVLLGGGGWLVIQGQLSLGQLVAAELIVTTILTSLAKLGKHLEGFYDAVAAVDKLGALFDLDLERHDGLMSAEHERGARVRITGVKRAQSGAFLAEQMTESFEPGERLGMYGPTGSGKTTLLRMVCGLDPPTTGHLEIDDADPRELRPDVLRDKVALVAEPELFEGTIEENVHLRRAGISSVDVRDALHTVGLLAAILRFPDGLQTRVNASGAPLTLSQQRLLMFARALVSDPQLLLVDGALDPLPDEDLELVRDALVDESRRWTLVVATGKWSVCQPLERVVNLGGGGAEQPAFPASGESSR